jgi:iron(III) transport system substrate-binding protein
MKKLLTRFSVAMLLATGGIGATYAARPLSLQEIATYQGADRQERLLEGAKKEGELTVYHAYRRLTAITSAFTKKYGRHGRFAVTGPWCAVRLPFAGGMKPVKYGCLRR